MRCVLSSGLPLRSTIATSAATPPMTDAPEGAFGLPPPDVPVAVAASAAAAQAGPPRWARSGMAGGELPGRLGPSTVSPPRSDDEDNRNDYLNGASNKLRARRRGDGHGS